MSHPMLTNQRRDRIVRAAACLEAPSAHFVKQFQAGHGRVKINPEIDETPIFVRADFLNPIDQSQTLLYCSEEATGVEITIESKLQQLLRVFRAQAFHPLFHSLPPLRAG